MPVSKKWSQATRAHIKRNVPEKKGIYELKCFGELKYIGKAKNLQRRLLEHNSDRDPNYYRFKKAGWLTSHSRLEDKHFTQYGSTDEEIPPWNKNDTRKRV